jgi:hypothetical protein
MNIANPSRKGLFAEDKPCLSRKALAQLLNVTVPAVVKWQKLGKLKPVATTRRGGPLFSFEQLAAALRETISLGFVPVLSKREKRCA